MKKDIEREILEYLDKSKDFWTDLYPFMRKSEYEYPEYYDVLKELINDDSIKEEKTNSINFLNTTKKGKLATIKKFTFKITPKGKIRLIDSRRKLYNEPWVGYIIALISFAFLVFQYYDNKDLKNQVQIVKKTADSTHVVIFSLNEKLDSLKSQVETRNNQNSDLILKEAIQNKSQ